MTDKLQQAIDALQAGDKEGAQGLLSSIIQANPRNEMAWYWMARAVDDPERKKECLGHVLAIDPDNQQAATELLQLQQPPPTEIGRPPAQQPAMMPVMAEKRQKRPWIGLIGMTAVLFGCMRIPATDSLLASPS